MKYKLLYTTDRFNWNSKVNKPDILITLLPYCTMLLTVLTYRPFIIDLSFTVVFYTPLI